MIPVTQLRKGVVFESDGQLLKVLEYEHIKMGRGSATIKTKLRNLRTGATAVKTFGNNDKVQDVRLDNQTVQFLYDDGDLYYFMNTETYEQPALTKELLEDIIPYLKEGTMIELQLHDGEPIGIDLPITVELKVVDAPNAVAGDTATGATKTVTMETGLVLNVPLFVSEGDILRIDTRTGEYLTRV